MSSVLIECGMSQADHSSLAIQWSQDYHTEWDAQPEEYVLHGLVGWGRSRRLARIEDPARAFKAYLGVQHDDPSRWNLTGSERSLYFLSLFLNHRTVALRTYTTLAAALDAIWRFHEQLYRTGVHWGASGRRFAAPRYC